MLPGADEVLDVGDVLMEADGAHDVVSDVLPEADAASDNGDVLLGSDTSRLYRGGMRHTCGNGSSSPCLACIRG